MSHAWLRVPAWVAMALALVRPAIAAEQAGGAGAYSVNQSTSTVDFTLSIRALFKLKKEGQFKDFTGEISYDPGRPDDTRVDLTVYTGSVDMHSVEHDQLLRSGEFFDVDHYPTMHFVSAGAALKGNGTLALTGDLTIRGITKRIAIDVTMNHASDRAPAPGLFETTFQIDRTEFGLNGVPKWGGMNVSVGKNVQIHIAIALKADRRLPAW